MSVLRTFTLCHADILANVVGPLGCNLFMSILSLRAPPCSWFQGFSFVIMFDIIISSHNSDSVPTPFPPPKKISILLHSFPPHIILKISVAGAAISLISSMCLISNSKERTTGWTWLCLQDRTQELLMTG